MNPLRRYPVLSSLLSPFRRSPVWRCDRGFHRVTWLKRLLDLEQAFVVRLTRDVTVHLPEGARLLKQLRVGEGERRDFGFVAVRADGAARVRLIGVWAAGTKEVWWPATNLTNRVSKVVSLYDRRMGIEEQFRDSKCCRFGLKLRSTQFTCAEYVEGWTRWPESRSYSGLRSGPPSKSRSRRCGWRVRRKECGSRT